MTVEGHDELFLGGNSQFQQSWKVTQHSDDRDIFERWRIELEEMLLLWQPPWRSGMP